MSIEEGGFDSTRTAQAFGLVVVAAATTGIGASAVFFPGLAKLATKKVLACSLGFATGVMLFVSLIDIYGKSITGFVEHGHTEDKAFIYTTLTFFGGIILMKILDMGIHFLLHSEGRYADPVEQGMDEMVARNEMLEGLPEVFEEEGNAKPIRYPARVKVNVAWRGQSAANLGCMSRPSFKLPFSGSAGKKIAPNRGMQAPFARPH
ncbi:Solute carrier family 39 (Metal ion transporter), member 11 [Seminavis robusta]|uniref:Solute carrier family 39 (Metal ion transporter), member 11 n=1 Tax=Seminavis robusta TaxID=568900 RepID=A0A9N8E3Z5_9STRA|nr:Solute carrier family 39 (Metal ion transporter), member 11 [Seminavis robusta]|eukprot:Sro638_g179520.1 Solute carrier family 39 (Metal ion transporter), member 11 (206) ;mRNA; r:6228-7022